jgi:hypothetical protein
LNLEQESRFTQKANYKGEDMENTAKKRFSIGWRKEKGLNRHNSIRPLSLSIYTKDK